MMLLHSVGYAMARRSGSCILMYPGIHHVTMVTTHNQCLMTDKVTVINIAGDSLILVMVLHVILT